MLGVMPTRDAQRLADDQSMDLVEISPNAEPPVCKIMDFGKFRYEESIRRKQARKNTSRTLVKEVKFHAGVEDNDLQTKLRQIRDFIEAGHKVKLTLQFRGRENAHKELGMQVIQRVIKEVDEVAVVEQPPRLFGRMLGCVMMPRPVKPSSGKSGQQQSAKPSAAKTGATVPRVPHQAPRVPQAPQAVPQAAPQVSQEPVSADA